MKKLDLVKINSCAPYAVKEDTQEGAYTFIADSGAEFSIGFMPDAAEPVRKQNHFVCCKNEKIRFSQD